MEENLPGVFSAAGFMVPSIMPLPIPFMDDVAGTAAEYIAVSLCRLCLAGRSSCRNYSGGARKRPQPKGGGMATMMIAAMEC